MNADNSTKIWLFLAALVIGIAAAFWPEMADTWSTPVVSMYKDEVIKPQLPIAATDLITDFRLGSGAEGPIKLMAQNLKTHRISSTMIGLGFTLVSSKASTVYPSIKIALVDESNKVIRTLVFSNTQYVHGATLSSEQISLDVRLQPGETGCTVQPFFPAP
jgi:hypothetical protein